MNSGKYKTRNLSNRATEYGCWLQDPYSMNKDEIPVSINKSSDGEKFHMETIFMFCRFPEWVVLEIVVDCGSVVWSQLNVTDWIGGEPFPKTDQPPNQFSMIYVISGASRIVIDILASEMEAGKVVC